MLLFGCSAFLLFGGVLVLVGSLQAELAANLGIGLRETGLLGATVVLGIAAGIFSAGPAIDRRAGRPLFIAAALLTAAALSLVHSDMSMTRALGHLFAAGFGAGFYETVLNTAAVVRYGDGSVRRLVFLHSAATFGAMLTPLLLAVAFHGSDGFVSGFRVLGAGHLALAIWALRSSALSSEPNPRTGGEASEARGVLKIVSERPAMLALVVAAFCYVGAETSITLFAVPFATESLGLDEERGQTAISAFWLGLLIMRLGVVLVPRSAGPRTIVLASAAAALILGAAAALSLRSIEVVLGLTGFAIGALFPLFVSLAGQLVPEARGSAVALASGLGSAGGFVVPWALGFLGEDHGASAVFAGVAVTCLVVSGAGAALVRALPSPAPGADARDSGP